LTICVRADELRLADRPGENRVAAVAVSVVERPGGVRLRMNMPGNVGVSVEVARAQWEMVKDRREHFVEFPPHSLRTMKSGPRCTFFVGGPAGDSQPWTLAFYSRAS